MRNEAPNDGQKRFFVIDESSLTSTKQMNEFFHRLQASDRVLLVGDTRQHEAVEAGRPYKQLQEAGMQTARLGEIVRQKDAALKEAVERFTRGDVFGGVASLDQQGRVHQLVSLKWMCRHTVGLNWTAIGIEHVGTSEAGVLGNARMLRASIRLTRWLQAKYGIADRDVVGHNESLTSPYHRERVVRLRTQTHADWPRRFMVRYRRALRDG